MLLFFIVNSDIISATKICKLKCNYQFHTLSKLHTNTIIHQIILLLSSKMKSAEMRRKEVDGSG